MPTGPRVSLEATKTIVHMSIIPATATLQRAALPALLCLWLACCPPATHADDTAADGGATALPRIPATQGGDLTTVALEDYYSADKSQRVQYQCSDENMPGGANEGASNPANVHCEATLYLKKSGRWVYADGLRLGQGHVLKFARFQLTAETVEYDLSKDALCCPSKISTLIFDTKNGKFVESLAAEGKPLLVKAIEDGADAKQVAELLKQGAHINISDSRKRTPLMFAVAMLKPDIVRLLLEHGANLNLKQEDGKSALLLAVDRRAGEIVKLLLENKADANTKQDDGSSALDIAVTNADGEAARLLLEHGARVNYENTSGETPLISSAIFPDLVEILLDKGANPNMATVEGKTALMVAAEKGRVESVKLLLDKGASPNLRDKAGLTVLLITTAYKTDLPDAAAKETISLVLNKGADINAKTQDGTTVLLQAAYKGKKELVRLLVEKGADINAENNSHETILTYYANDRQRDCELVRYLLEKGAAPNGPTSSTSTLPPWAAPLRWASYGNSSECIRALLDKGADVRAQQGAVGSVALEAAVQSGNLEIVQLLLDHGADPNIPTSWVGGNVYGEAIRLGHTKIANLLEGYMIKQPPAPPPSPPITSMVDMGLVAEIALLVGAISGAGALLMIRRKKLSQPS